MKLKTLLQDLEYNYIDIHGKPITGREEVEKAGNTEVAAITNDSRKAERGSLFFCIVGAVSDGHDFAKAVQEAGAAVLVVEHLPVLDENRTAPVLVQVKNSRYAMALISASWFDHPATKMKMIGITGTKGKTTTTYLVRSMLEHAGIRTGLIGTIESTWKEAWKPQEEELEKEGLRKEGLRKEESPKEGSEKKDTAAAAEREIHIPSSTTTPESLALQSLLDRMQKAGVQAVVMEVSSQALKLGRTAGVTYDIGVFTNISPDHIGPHEHASFEEYMQCKGLLFQQCKVGIVNGDDPHVQDVLKGHTCQVETFGLQSTNDLWADHLQLVRKPGELGISFDTEGRLAKDAAGSLRLHAEVPTPGRFSVYNALCAIAICRHFNVTAPEIEEALRSAHVKGRIEMVPVSPDFTVLIDYAHNAVALESLLNALREYQPHRLITLFGCGGNRSKLRRFEMGEVSGRLSDFTIITSDNPRFEDPEAIIADIVTGMKRTEGKYITITDRREAIAWAIHHGEPGDIIVLAGKGHEDYQEIKGRKYPMDERVIIQEILAQDRHTGVQS